MKPASVFRRTQTAVGPVLLIHCAIILWAVTGLHLFANDFQTDHPPSAAGRPPLVFEHNPLRQPGQSFLRACAQDYTAFLTRDSAIFALGPAASPTLVRMRLIDTTPASPVDAIDGVYPTADNPHASVAALQPTASLPRAVYGQVRYRGVYPGVDLVYRDQNGLLEYDFIVAPGADPTRIRLTFNTLIVPRSGTGFQPASSVTPPNNALSHIELDPTGALILHTPAGTVRQTKPVIYQELAGNRRPVTGAFRLRGPREVGFQIGAYDPSLPLVIDPVLVYSGLLGGSADEGASSVAVDDDGNAYITGTTLSLDFPVTTGTNTTPQGGQDAYVAKFSPTGALLYCTLVGGPCEDTGNAIAVDSAGNAYITGRAGLCFATGLSPGVMVAKLSPTGSLVYLYSFGGSLADTSAGYAIAVDPDGNAYTTGTAQASSSDFPVTPGAFQTNRCGGIADGFVAKVNPAGTGLVYCTYLCGSDFDVPQAIAIDSARNAYIGGKTSSHDFP
ncbi:MAG TPA: SBBP repeat-containing protein, partial [Clostridia bacterium]|nr:SBBP repeat-containing protein [Clostridia bacterium]